MSDPSHLKNRVFLLPNKLLTLKALTPKDVGAEYVDWFNDYEVVRYTGQTFVKHNKEGVIYFAKDKLNSNINVLYGKYL